MEHVSKVDGRASIDNGAWYRGVLTLSQAMLDVTTLGGMSKPSQSWEVVDPAGHFHSWTADGKLPSLTATVEHVCSNGGGTEHYGAEDDDECNGYTKTTYACRICGWDVEPGYVRDIAPQFLPGLKSWRVDMHGVPAIGDGRMVSERALVSLVFMCEGRGKWFGVAKVGSVLMDYPSGFGVMLLGAGELGQKK
jgi:hypothetical protein